jgi:hemolysin D
MSLQHKFSAFAALFRHYRQTFSLTWKNREQLKDRQFTNIEADYLPAALSIQETPVSPTLRTTAKVLILLLILFACWALFGRLDIVVSVTGEIKLHGRTKSIAAIETASVRAIHVVEGQFVKKGDPLIELDATAPDAEHDKAESSSLEARLQIARSQAMIAAAESRKSPRLSPVAGVPAQKLREAQEQLEGQFNDFMAKLQRIDGAIARYSETLTLITKRASDYRELAQNHDISLHAYLEKEQERVEVEGQLNDAKKQRVALIAETKQAAYTERSTADKILAAARQDVLKNAVRSKLLKLTSPVDGTVQQLLVHTVGGVVPGAQPLMIIVPKEDKIEVEAMLENRDVGFVKEGQMAAVKIEAFEFTKFGVIPGRVVHISSDAIKDEKKGLLYSVLIELDKSSIVVNGKDIPLSPGMSVRADIKTGSRRVVEYFLSPLLQHKKESLRER